MAIALDYITFSFTTAPWCHTQSMQFWCPGQWLSSHLWNVDPVLLYPLHSWNKCRIALPIIPPFSSRFHHQRFKVTTDLWKVLSWLSSIWYKRGISFHDFCCIIDLQVITIMRVDPDWCNPTFELSLSPVWSGVLESSSRGSWPTWHRVN